MVEEIDYDKLKISEKSLMLYLDLLEWLDTNWNKSISRSILTQFQSSEIPKETNQKIDKFVKSKIPRVIKELKCSESKEKLHAMLWYYHHNVHEIEL